MTAAVFAASAEKYTLEVIVDLPNFLPCGSFQGKVTAKVSETESYTKDFSLGFEEYAGRVTFEFDEPCECELSYVLTKSSEPLLSTNTVYYYTGSDGFGPGDFCWLSHDYAALVPVTEEYQFTRFYMTTNKLITGKFVSVDDDPVVFSTARAMGFGIYSDSIVDWNPGVVDHEGNFIITVMYDYQGECKIDASIYQNNVFKTNIYSYRENCFYASTGNEAVHERDEASTYTMGDSGISGVTIPVETGWVLTGGMDIEEGGYINYPEDFNTTGCPIVIERPDGDEYYMEDIWLYEDGTIEYYTVIKKVPGVYSFYRSPFYIDDFDTNLYLEEEQTLPDMEISGSMYGIDFPIEVAGGIVSGNLIRTEDFDEDITIYLTFTFNPGASDEIKYTISRTINKGKKQTFFKRGFPKELEGRKYTVTYESFTSGIERYGYMKSDGTISRNSADAALFTLKKTDTKDVQLIELIPYLKGKVYVPAEVDTDFGIGIHSSMTGASSVSINVKLDECKTDEKGRYFEYELKQNGAEGFKDYYIYYEVNPKEYGVDSPLYSYHALFYLGDGERGLFSTKAYLFSPKTPQTFDFTLLLWDSGEKTVYTTPHGYMEGETLYYSFSYPDNVKSVTLYFSRLTDRDITIRNGSDNLGYISSNTINTLRNSITVESNKFQVSFTSSRYYPTYGFGLVRIELNYAYGGSSVSEIVGVYSMDGAEAVTDLTPLKRVQAGKAIRAEIHDESIASEQEIRGFGVVYDTLGRMLEVVVVNVQGKAGHDGYYTVDFSFDSHPDAAKLTVIFTDDSGAPIMRSYSMNE